jgi:hypothetical protein
MHLLSDELRSMTNTSYVLIKLSLSKIHVNYLVAVLL